MEPQYNSADEQPPQEADPNKPESLYEKINRLQNQKDQLLWNNRAHFLSSVEGFIALIHHPDECLTAIETNTIPQFLERVKKKDPLVRKLQNGQTPAIPNPHAPTLPENPEPTLIHPDLPYVQPTPPTNPELTPAQTSTPSQPNTLNRPLYQPQEIQNEGPYPTQPSPNQLPIYLPTSPTQESTIPQETQIIPKPSFQPPIQNSITTSVSELTQSNWPLPQDAPNPNEPSIPANQIPTDIQSAFPDGLNENKIQ